MSGSVRNIAQTALKGSGSYAANACSSFGHLDEKHTHVNREETEEEEINQEEEEKELAKDTGTSGKRKEWEKEATTKERKLSPKDPGSPKDPAKEKNRKREESEAKHTKKEDKLKEFAEDVGKVVLKTALISGLVIGGTALALPAIGFGALGPIGGSLAALYQSTVLGGTIASGSAFATLQSVGMVGLSAAAKTSIVGVSAAVSAATTAASRQKKKDEDKKGS